MSILIRGMEMPTSCNACMFDVYGLCLINKNIEGKDELTHSCPLIEIPPHGDLIDRDAFVAAQRHLYCENCDRRRGMKDGKLTKKFAYAIGDAPCRACDIEDVLDSLEDYAPTIIPASEEGE